MHTRKPAVRVRGMLRCAEIYYRTRTRATRFGNTAGFSVPVLNPTSPVIVGCDRAELVGVDKWSVRVILYRCRKSRYCADKITIADLLLC